MRTTLTINIPKPCHEDWNTMTPEKKGRHCSSCEKTVYDFTASTDEHIVKTFLDEGKICGRFKSTQLKRELVLSRKEKNNYLRYIASTLFAFLSFGTQDVEAQGKPKIVNVDSLKPQIVNKKIGTSVLNTKLINGRIFNSEKFPIPNVEISVKNSAISTNSNISGHFNIKVKFENILIIKASGYETAEITINDFGKLQIYLKTQTRKKVTSVIADSHPKEIKTETTTTLLGGIAGFPIIIKQDNIEDPLPIVNGSLAGSSSYFLYSMRRIFNRKIKT
jgi:hypothetical protein